MIRHQRVGGNGQLIIIRMIRVLPEGRSSKSSFIFFTRNIDRFVLLREIEVVFFVHLSTCLPACLPPSCSAHFQQLPSRRAQLVSKCVCEALPCSPWTCSNLCWAKQKGSWVLKHSKEKIEIINVTAVLWALCKVTSSLYHGPLLIGLLLLWRTKMYKYPELSPGTWMITGPYPHFHATPSPNKLHVCRHQSPANPATSIFLAPLCLSTFQHANQGKLSYKGISCVSFSGCVCRVMQQDRCNSVYVSISLNSC